jgi:hypothetical protein
MKLRLQSNSIRLRLKRGEVDQLVRAGRVEEEIVFGPGRGGTLKYVLETSPILPAPTALLHKDSVLVQVPMKTAIQWASGPEIGIEEIQASGDGATLQILIVKDFACLNGTDEQNIDTFPHPLAGTKC